MRHEVLEFGGFLGVGTDRYPIPWSVLRYSTDKGGYIAPLDKAALERAPKYGESSVPVYDYEYGSKIDPITIVLGLDLPKPPAPGGLASPNSTGS